MVGDGGLAVAVGSTRRGRRVDVDRNEKKGARKLGVVFLFCLAVYGTITHHHVGKEKYGGHVQRRISIFPFFFLKEKRR